METSRLERVPRTNGARAARTTLVGRINKRAIFEHFLANRRASLRDLADSLQMSAPTVRKAVGSLSATGLIEELSEKQHSATGRPGAVYCLSTKKSRLVGVSLSTATVEVVESGLDGAMGDERRHVFPTPGAYSELVATIASAIRKITPPDARVLAVGLSVPGEVDLVQQRVVYSPLLHVTDGHYLARDIERELAYKGVRVAIYKDTACGCLVERHWGVAREARDFVVLGVREGFGAGVWLNGQLLGGRGIRAPEVGHITVVDNGELCSCGNRGCLETLATDAAFARRVNRRYGESWDMATIVERAKRGTLDVTAELQTSIHYVATGIAAIINLFDPELLCLDTQMLEISPAVFDMLKRETARLAFASRRDSCELRRTGHRIDNSRGALAAALHDFLGSVGPSTLDSPPLDD